MSSDPRLSSPEFLNAYDGTKTIVVSVIFILLEILFVSLRTYSRTLTEAWGLDDTLIWIALPICVALDGIAIGMVQYAGVGRHQLALIALHEKYKLIRWSKFVIASGWLYLLAVSLPKLCILSLYLRIFPTKRYRITCYILVVVVIGGCVGGITAGMLLCRPLGRFWDKSIPGECIDVQALFRWVGFPNIVTDAVIMILPLPLVWNLQTSKQQKIGLGITFLTGSVGLISSALRFRVFFTKDALTDSTWASSDLMLWTVVEPGMYLIAACLIKLKPLVRKIVRGTFLARWGTSGSTRRDHYPGGSIQLQSSATAKRGFKSLSNSEEHGSLRATESGEVQLVRA